MNRLSTITRAQWEWIGVVGIAILLRCVSLGWRSVWLDEAITVHIASQSWLAIWSGAADPVHPPLYYSLIKLIHPLHPSAAWVRLPSMIASLGMLWPLRRIGDFVGGKRAGLLAAALLAVAPLDIWYAQEARMYALVAFLGVMAAWGLLNSGRFSPLITLVAATVGLYIDYSFFPLLLLLWGIAFGRLWQQGARGQALLGHLWPPFLAMLLYAPWWSQLFTFLARIENVHAVDGVLKRLGVEGIPAGIPLIALLALFTLSTLTTNFLLKSNKVELPRWGWVSIVCLFAILTLLTPIPRLYSLKRLLVIGWPFVTVLVGWILIQLNQPRLTQAILAISLVAAVINLAVPKDDYAGAAAFIDEHAAAADLVWSDPFFYDVPFNWYDPNPSAQSGRLNDLKRLTEDLTVVWLVATRFPGDEIPSSAAEIWLDRELELTETISFYRLEVRRYESR